MQMYDMNIANKILVLPLLKIQTQSTRDQVIWSNSTTGDYQVKRAYALLHQDQPQKPYQAQISNNSTYKNLAKSMETETSQQTLYLHLETTAPSITSQNRVEP